MVDATLSAAADELYGLVPSAFVAARTALAASATDRDTAAQIRALRKPPTSAWVVNLLARRDPAGVGKLAELAAEMREAQDDRDAARLTALNKDRRDLLAELVRRATALAQGEGVALGAGIVGEVERTLGAAARDGAAAAAVRTGRLLRPLEASGVDPIDLMDAVAGDAPAAADPAPVRGRDDLAERRARRDAERAAVAVRREAADAERESARAEARLATAREREALLQERVESLESELARIRADADAATVERHAAESARDVSAERLRTANRAAARLTGPS
ncbi:MULTISPECIES: transposase [Bacteria]